ncbi:MAG: hypothetical protein IJ437_04135 [Clostridia bacterium]|nr:hypothetical protein [Clostridia bacterium]
MELAAKIFIIIGMICGFWMILPLVFGFIALGKIKRGEVTVVWAVLTLLFCSLLGGIFMFFLPKKA